MRTRHRSSSPRRCSLVLAVGLSALASATACKGGKDTCDPEQHGYRTVTVHLQAAAALNLDDEGHALPTVVRIAQLEGDLALRDLDVAALWDDPEAALGDELIGVKELQIYPDSVEQLVIEPDPRARFVLAFAGFRQPIGTGWYRVYRLPERYGEQVCAHVDAGEDPAAFGEPCMYLTLERSQIDGGELPPPGFDLARLEGRCAPTSPTE